MIKLVLFLYLATLYKWKYAAHNEHDTRVAKMLFPLIAITINIVRRLNKLYTNVIRPFILGDIK